MRSTSVDVPDLNEGIVPQQFTDGPTLLGEELLDLLRVLVVVRVRQMDVPLGEIRTGCGIG